MPCLTPKQKFAKQREAKARETRVSQDAAADATLEQVSDCLARCTVRPPLCTPSACTCVPTTLYAAVVYVVAPIVAICLHCRPQHCRRTSHDVAAPRTTTLLTLTLTLTVIAPLLARCNCGAAHTRP